MNDIVRQKLCELVRSMEPGLLDQPQRLRGILSDECPGCRREVNVLLTALQHRVAADLQTRSANLPWAIQAARLVKRLVEDAALSEDAARWAVDSWGLALGATLAVAPSPAPAIVPAAPANLSAPRGPAVVAPSRAKALNGSRYWLVTVGVLIGLWLFGAWWFFRDTQSTAKRDAEPVVDMDLSKNQITNTVGMTLKRIPTGKFLMGDAEGDGGLIPSPRHWVEIAKPFYIGQFEVTQAQYRKVMGGNPSAIVGDRLPVERVAWAQADEFCKRLSKMENREYTLPTEAEWEYCCRAGTATEFHFGRTLPKGAANFSGEPDAMGHGLGARTKIVGSFEPNAWGLHDMHGNVWEWCADWNQIPDHLAPSLKDGKGGAVGKSRNFRGGSFRYGAIACRSANRGHGEPTECRDDIGFRVVLRIPPPPSVPLTPSSGTSAVGQEPVTAKFQIFPPGSKGKEK